MTKASKRVLEAERDFLLESIGYLDVQIAESVWDGSHGGHDPEFNKLGNGLKKFWVEKAAKDPHPFTYCVRHLRKHVANPERLCFAPDTLVETRDRGQIVIQDIIPGEFVRTHTGEFREVLGTRTNKTAGRKMKSFDVECGEAPLVVTEDHPMLIARGARFIEGTRTRLRTKEARSEVGLVDNRRDAASMLYPKQQIGNIERVAAGDVQDCDYLLYPRQREIKDAPVSDDYLWLLGMFAAEGSWGSHTPRWCYGIEEPLAKECVERLERETGSKARIVRLPTSDHVCLDKGQRGHHRSLTEALQLGISGNVWTKRFESWVLALPEDRLRIVLEAYWQGDGHHRPNRSEAVATTVSRDLAYQLRQMLIYLGERPSIKQVRDHREDVIQGRTVIGRPTWAVSYNPNRSRRANLGSDDYIAFPIRSITDGSDLEWVHTLHVSEHNTVVAGGALRARLYPVGRARRAGCNPQGYDQPVWWTRT